jgi:hypothetical protein
VLWKDIFALATSWLRLPGEGDDLLNLAETWEKCWNFHRYHASIPIRTNLRLVCRSWNALIQTMNDDLILTDFESIYWPSKGSLLSASFINAGNAAFACHCLPQRTVITMKWVIKSSPQKGSPSKSYSRFDGFNHSQMDQVFKAKAVHLAWEPSQPLPPRFSSVFPWL